MGENQMKYNPLVSIAVVVGGVSVAIVVMIGIFSKEHMWAAAPTVGALATMGILLGLGVLLLGMAPHSTV